MELEEFDDSILDEDFIQAFDNASSSHDSQPLRAAGVKGLNQQARNRTAHNQRDPVLEDLDDLPSDAFSSPEPQTTFAQNGRTHNGVKRSVLQDTTSTALRQTTLFGGTASSDAPPRSQADVARPYRTNREPPSHHTLDTDAMRTWVYPTNLGAIRNYQFSIVKNSLFNNTLVALPTGLGKTFIAATVMLNFYRWTKTAKIVFVAPTKPLASQQVDACYNIVGIPRSETTLLTGDVQPALRVDEWQEKRVFFMTPQTLMNDLSKGYADPKSIALLVVDEAHRATGEYAYAKVTKFIRRFSSSMRVLALTATPGSKLESVQEVIDNLGISHCEIRTEKSIDIREHVHSRDVDLQVLDPSDEMNLVSELFVKALKPMMDKLSAQNIWYARNPMALTSYGLMQAQKEWFEARGRSANQGLQHMMRAIFSTLTSIAHSIKLLNFHGIKPFYENMRDLRTEQEDRGEKGSKYKKQLIKDASFQEMMSKIELWLRTDGFVGHPKLTALSESVLNHFMDHGESTRVIVFSEYRDSAEDIVKTLNQHKPLIKASIFVGQADGKRGEGMKQSKQIETLESFRRGDFNVLVATSIGEEGLDIGQVDLIVCYDSSSSPIRMLQRMGRTGRKRAGHIVLLLMRGKEEEQYAKSKDNYEKMQQLICEGSRFNFRHDLSTRIVPREIIPEVDKRRVLIPIENTQDTSLPEPKKRRAPAKKKKVEKKFHMPDGVETGFQSVTSMLNIGSKTKGSVKRDQEMAEIAEIPPLRNVLLRDNETQDLDRTYRDLPFTNNAVEETCMPDLTAHPHDQRQLKSTSRFRHGIRAKKLVRALRSMSHRDLERDCRDTDTSNYMEIPVRPFVDTDGEDEDGWNEERAPSPKRRKTSKLVAAKSQAQRPSKATVNKKAAHDTVEAATTKERTTGAPRAAVRAFISAETGGGFNRDADDDSEEDESDEDGCIMAARGVGKGRKGKRRKTVPQWSQHGINSDALGDACDRDSDALESDGDDDGADLVDFIVSDNHVVSSAPDAYALPSSPPPTATPRGPVPGQRRSGKTMSRGKAVPVLDGAEDDGDDDLPEIEQLLSSTRKGVPDQGKEGLARKKAARGARRVLDSDSDE